MKSMDKSSPSYVPCLQWRVRQFRWRLCIELSRSAVSHAIANLEDELEVLLLSRGRHGANLTPVGSE